MSKLRPQLNVDTKSVVGYAFECPGCGSPHVFWTHPFYDQAVWDFDGNMTEPTFSPSLLNTWIWGPERVPKSCHLFLKQGKIIYLGDCTHSLAGQTIDLPEFKSW